jgi:hypothetical protein
VQPLLQWKINKYCLFWECVCSLNYPACNVQTPYFHLWPARLYVIFPHYLINGTIFGTMMLNMKCVFRFSLQIFTKTFFTLRGTEGDMVEKIQCVSKKSFTTLKAYRNLYRGRIQRFELSKCSKTHRVLPRIVIRNCFDFFFN